MYSLKKNDNVFTITVMLKGKKSLLFQGITEPFLLFIVRHGDYAA